MLEPPKIQHDQIAACLQTAYGLESVNFTFLPLGADVCTAVYRVETAENAAFLKLRIGGFNELSVELPRFLADQGIGHIIVPLPTLSGGLYTRIGSYTAVLLPFVDGENAFHHPLSEQQWMGFGEALRKIHSLEIPPDLASRLRCETYHSHFRRKVRQYLEAVDSLQALDSTARKVVRLLKTHQSVIHTLLRQTAALARYLKSQSFKEVLCHSDLHAGNVLIDRGGRLYLVDWDDPILAPKEHDLMYVGGAQGFLSSSPQEEELLFYRGYGKTGVSVSALKYYRLERIIQDIAAFCDELLLTGEGGQDREQSYAYLASNFLPGGTLDIAYQTQFPAAAE